MSDPLDQSDALDHLVNIGGAGAKHLARPQLPLTVAPATGAEFNTLREALTPVACVLLKDSRFEFDSSFIGPKATTQLKFLAKLRKAQSGIVASIFGHADPVGNDDYNKSLSGRRAQAVYGLLTRKVALWEELFSTPLPLGGDKWDAAVIQLMLQTLGFSGESAPSGQSLAQQAIKDFQSENGLAPDGNAGSATRAVLFKAYMDAICVDSEGQSFSLDPAADFLAHNEDAGGKGDFQGCGEFNPVLLLSKGQLAAFAPDPDDKKRNEANRPSRRAMIFLFRAGARFPATEWPCPRAKEGTAGCRKRFFSNGDSRRTSGETERQYQNTRDTFACRFYDRLAVNSPCETGAEETIKCHVSLLLRSNSACVPLANRKYKITINADRTLEGTTDADGFLEHPDVPPGDYRLEIEGHETFVPATPTFRKRRTHQVDGFFLFEDDVVPVAAGAALPSPVAFA